MFSRFWLAIVALTLFSAPVFAECHGYSETFDVRVLDGTLKPVVGADVIVTYDPGTSFGSKYFTTAPRKTDESGKVRFQIFNQGTNTRPIDCNIKINASSGGASKVVTVVAGEHGPIVDVIFSDVYALRFYVRDQLRAPIENASVTVGNVTQKTDGTGLSRFFLKTGNYSYFASYLDAQQPGTIEITNETNYEVIFAYYKVSIDVRDDAGNPLPAMLTVYNSTFELQNGHFENEKTFGESIPYVVDYKGLVTEGVIYPSANPIVQVTYDINSPIFGPITPGFLNNRPRLEIPLSDPNEFASGVDISSVRVFYRMEPSEASTPWSSAIVFTSGKDKFTADFPELPPNRIVNFRIEAKDKAGNRADIEGKFSTLAGQQPPNDTQNQTNTQPPPSQEQGIPPIYIVGGVIIVILGIFLVFRIKSKASGGG